LANIAAYCFSKIAAQANRVFTGVYRLGNRAANGFWFLIVIIMFIILSECCDASQYNYLVNVFM